MRAFLEKRGTSQILRLPYDYHLKRYEMIGARQRAMLLCEVLVYKDEWWHTKELWLVCELRYKIGVSSTYTFIFVYVLKVVG